MRRSGTNLGKEENLMKKQKVPDCEPSTKKVQLTGVDKAVWKKFKMKAVEQDQTLGKAASDALEHWTDHV